MKDINKPLYEKIYDYIIDNIKNGTYGEGERIPSEKELAEQFKVSRITSKKALELLAENGYIKRLRGKGSFVLGDKNREDTTNNVVSSKTYNTGLIGVILADFSDTYGTQLLSGIEREASKNGAFVIIKRSYDQQSIENKDLDTLLHMGVDGIIVMSVHDENYNPKILRLLLDGFPIVLVDRHLKGIPAPFIGSDNFEASKKATDYLLNLGHRHISFISPHVIETSTIGERIEGFVKSHAEHGVAVDESIWITDMISTIPGNRDREKVESDIEKVKDVLKRNPNITCLFAAEYDLAVIAAKAVSLLDKKIPDDISILCFDGPLNCVGEYTFTHIRQRENEMGEGAFKLLQKQIRNEGGNDKIFLDTDLIVGKSTKKVSNK